MDETDSLKSRLIDELWLPIVQQGGLILYPRRKNKKMKLFTLTNDRNFEEITKFLENITVIDQVIAWTYSHLKKIRLETDTGCSVEGCSRLEESSVAESLGAHFPFDVINLDFSSQDPISHTGRIEKEINKLECIICLQNEKLKNTFILIYTTILDSFNINKREIISNSNFINAPAWGGLQLQNFQDAITSQNEKINFIEETIKEVLPKFKYVAHKIDKKFYTLSDNQKVVSSIILIVKRGQ